MDTNTGGFLKPGSTDVSKVKDLQKKLKLEGIDIVVNGEFGKATETAVMNYKKSIGINDGFLTKNGSFAITPIVTPQMWGVLNASVAARLNPNGNITSGTYSPPVTKTELDWAKQLQQKISQFGYKPSQPERQKYDDIYQRQQMAKQIANGSVNPTQASPPTKEEMDWAKDMAVKMGQFGYKPNNAEKAKYQEIYQKNKISKSSPAQTEQPAENQTKINSGVTKAEMDWALKLQQMIKSGYQPNPQQEAKYNEIFAKYNSSQVNTPPQNQGVSKADYNWAVNFVNQVKNGYQPSAAEEARYQEIFQAQKTQKNSGSPTESELKWASHLEDRVNSQGYMPTQKEKETYENIFSRYNASQGNNQTQNSVATQSVSNNLGPEYTPPQQNQQPMLTSDGSKPTEAEVQWALTLEKKVKTNNYQPNQTELAAYNDISNRLINFNNKTAVDPLHGRSVQNMAQNIQPTGPATQGAVTQQELDWAQELQTKVSQGYKPSQTEMTMYTSIYNRAQGGGSQPQVNNNQQPNFNNNQPVSGNDDLPALENGNTQYQQPNIGPTINAPMLTVNSSSSDPELQWALGLLDKVQKGYPPTQEEALKYEQIIAKNRIAQ